MPNPRRFLPACLLGLAALTAVPGAAADLVVSGEFSSSRAPLIMLGEVGVPTDLAVARLLDEARAVFGGMIYGYRFVYVPSDRDRRVKEEFALEPLALIEAGDGALDVRQVLDDGETIRVFLRYHLRDFQRPLYEAWQSGAIPSAAGRGEASFHSGWEGRLAAVADAVKEAVRDYVRHRVHAKPRRIEGSVALAEPPRIVVDSGEYRVLVRIRLRVENVRAYAAF